MMISSVLTCPVCQAALNYPEGDVKRLVCKAGHSFDRAKQGYWNLLLAQNKRSKAPGDSKDMLVARRAFLSQGYYQPIADTVNNALIRALGTKQTALVADIGCGEGYYTEQMDQLMSTQLSAHQIIAVDISKDAARIASQKYKQPSLFWAVASGARLPLAPHSLDVACVLFSRLMPEPLYNNLKSDGELIAVWPGQQHLIELRQRIYKSVRDESLDASQLLSSHFDEVDIQVLTTEICLIHADDVANLLLMTPHGHRIQDKATELLSEGQLKLTLDVNVGRYRPKQLA